MDNSILSAHIIREETVEYTGVFFSYNLFHKFACFFDLSFSYKWMKLANLFQNQMPSFGCVLLHHLQASDSTVLVL